MGKDDCCCMQSCVKWNMKHVTYHKRWPITSVHLVLLHTYIHTYVQCFYKFWQVSDSSISTLWLVSITAGLHIMRVWVITMMLEKPIRSAVIVGAQWVGGQQWYWSRHKEVNRAVWTHTLSQHILCGKSSSTSSSSITGTQAVHTHTSFPRLPFFCQLLCQTVSHHCCVATEDLCLSDRFYTAQTDPQRNPLYG